MINISNCPVNKDLKRKLDYDFIWHRTRNQIRIRCKISHYKDDELIENLAIKSFEKELIASDSMVKKADGSFFVPTEELPTLNEPIRNQFNSEEDFNTANANWEDVIKDYCTEYDYYVGVIGKTPIILPDLLEQIILLRDSQGKLSPNA